MSLFFRNGGGKRAANLSGLIPPRDGFASSSFAVPVTEDSAAQVVAYNSSVSLLAAIVSSLPLNVYTGKGDSQREAPRPSWLDDPQGLGYGLEDWTKQYVTSACYTGNVVIQSGARDGNGLPTVFHIRPPRVVWSDGQRWVIHGREVDRRDVIHYRRWPVVGEVFGLSPIQQHATTFSLALSADRFGVQWFSEGAHPSQILYTDQAVDDELAQQVKARVLATMTGSRGPAVLGSGLKLEAFQVAPEESQFLETKGFTAAEVCRILGPGLAEILGYKTGDALTYKNREQMALDLLAYTVDPWLSDLERLLSRQLNAPGVRGGRWVEFDRSALLRTDMLSRFQAYRVALGPHEPFMTANEVRRPEADLPPLAWGDDKPTIQGSVSNGGSDGNGPVPPG